MSDFHYLLVPGEDGGVGLAHGEPQGLDLRAILERGVPPLSVGLSLISAIAQVMCIFHEDGNPHGTLAMHRVHLDDLGTLSIEGFGAGGDDAVDRDHHGLGLLALELLGGPRLDVGATEADVIDALIGTDLTELDAGILEDVQWFVARLLDRDPLCRPAAVRVWRSFVAFAAATEGPRLEAWSRAAVDGAGERRQPRNTRADARSTLFLQADAEPGGGTKTSYWTRAQLEAIAQDSALAPRPQRCAEVKLPGGRALGSVTTVLRKGLAEEVDGDRRLFKVEQCLGRGGFGEVYLCTMSNAAGMRSRVAVKVLREGIDPRAQAVRRLRDEARVLGTLEHPAILTAHDLIVLADRVAMVTEYVPGADLDVCLAGDDRPPLPALLSILAITAEALEAGWTAKDADGNPLRLVHRDIKPSNIRVGIHGQVKVLDFGIAKFASSREAQTLNNQLIGTVSYMAPERLASATDHPAGDVYALGAVLYEALAGIGLWDLKTSREQFDIPRDPGEHDRHVVQHVQALEADEGIRSLLLRTLAYAPEDRPTAGLLGRELEDLADEMPGRNLRRWARSHLWPAAGAFEGELVGRTLSEGRPISRPVGPERSVATPVPVERAAPVVPAAPAIHQVATVPASPVRSAAASFEGAELETERLDDEPTEGSPYLAWAGIAALGSGLFAATVVGLLVLAWIAIPSSGPPEPALPLPIAVADVEPVAPALPLTPVPMPVVVPPEPPGFAPTPAVPTAVPEPDPVAPVALVAPVAPVEAGCGALETLEAHAAAGRLSSADTACLTRGMQDPTLKMTDRQKFGRVLLVAAYGTCAPNARCPGYEALQDDFFEHLDRSDPDLLFTYAEHLSQSAGADVARWDKASLAADRALERKSAWPAGRSRNRKLIALHRIRALAALKLYEQTPSERHRGLVRDRAVEWAELLRSLNQDASEAFALCVSATGSTETCDKRVTLDALEEKITVLSVPPRALLTVDGVARGSTPAQVPLVHGAHVLELTIGERSVTHTIQVGAGKPVRWQYVREDDVWNSDL